MHYRANRTTTIGIPFDAALRTTEIMMQPEERILLISAPHAGAGGLFCLDGSTVFNIDRIATQGPRRPLQTVPDVAT